MKPDKIKRPVVVCTDKRGVYFGYLEGEWTPELIRLVDVRMAVFWSAETRGIVNLAKAGPAPGSKITAAAPAAELTGIHAVFDCSTVAVAAWESAPWG